MRLYAIDAPELSQPYGVKARDEMRKMARGSMRLDAVSNDRYGRVVGVVYRRNRKKSLNHMIVAAGLAYSYQRYGKLDGIDEAEARARKRRLGIWKSGESQTRPWEHRRASGRRRHKKRRWRLRLAVMLAVLVAAAIGLQWQVLGRKAHGDTRRLNLVAGLSVGCVDISFQPYHRADELQEAHISVG